MGDSQKESDKMREDVRMLLTFFTLTRTSKPMLDAHGRRDIRPRWSDNAANGDWLAMAEDFRYDMLESYPVTRSQEEIRALLKGNDGLRLGFPDLAHGVIDLLVEEAMCQEPRDWAYRGGEWTLGTLARHQVEGLDIAVSRRVVNLPFTRPRPKGGLVRGGSASIRWTNRRWYGETFPCRYFVVLGMKTHR